MCQGIVVGLEWKRDHLFKLKTQVKGETREKGQGEMKQSELCRKERTIMGASGELYYL